MFFPDSNSSVKLGRSVIKDVYYFGESPMLDCNQFIINDKSTGELALFDSGNGISLKGLFEGMNNLGLDYRKITKVFLTHEHVDHVLGLYPLIEALKSNPPKLYAYGDTVKILVEGDESRIFPGNLGISPKMFNLEIIPLDIVDLKLDEPIRIGSNFTLKVFHTPGHSHGSVCYYEETKKILIPGDLVFTSGSFGKYDFPGGSLDALINSIKFANELDVKYLLPGHMGISDKGNQQVEYSYSMVQSMKSFF